MAHPLDRPIWSALTGPQAHLARGDTRAWRIDPAIGLFAAAAASSPPDTAAIAALVTHEAPLVLFEDEPWPADAAIAVTADTMVQVVADTVDPLAHDAAIQPLGDADVAEMLALTALTRPGPFLARTHQLGGFVGIREGGVLAAMAGTRLRVPGHVEVSGVCTHPDHRGRGHGAQLMIAVATAILGDGDRPFLHAFASNVQAITLYERLGFRIRRRLTASFLSCVPASA